MKQPEHGTYSTYCYHKCRCTECTAANTAYGRQWRKQNPDYMRIAYQIRKRQKKATQ